MNSIRNFLRKYAPQFLAGFLVGLLFLVSPYYLFTVRDDVASIITLFGIILTAYVAFYAIAWAKYEFHITRQSQQMSVLAALCATDKRKSFAPALAEMTRKKLPKHPTLFTPHLILFSLCTSSNDERLLTEDNQDTINMVAKILLGFDDWRDADFHSINLTKAHLCNVNLEDTNLREACFTEAVLISSNLELADLRGAKLNDADLRNAKLKGTILDKANFSGVDLAHADLRVLIFRSTCYTHENTVSLQEKALRDVKSLYKAELEDKVYNTLKEKYPALFTKPSGNFDEIFSPFFRTS